MTLSPKQKRILHQLYISGEQPIANFKHIYANRALFASLSELKREGLIDNPIKGVWGLTDKGYKTAREL